MYLVSINLDQEEDDMVAQEEERMNMRKHFFMTIDKNRDMIISKKEFVHYVTGDQFEKTQTELERRKSSDICKIGLS